MFKGLKKFHVGTEMMVLGNYKGEKHADEQQFCAMFIEAEVGFWIFAFC